MRKREKYCDVKWSEFDFIPFILEAQGGAGKAAHRFSKELEKRKQMRTCTPTWDRSRRLDLMIGLNIEVQRFNSTAILERVPSVEPLCGSELQKNELALQQERVLAKERLQNRNSKPCRAFMSELRQKVLPYIFRI